MGLKSVVLIPVHNRRDITDACLENLRNMKVEAWADIFVIDDGSNDGTKEILLSKYPHTKIIFGNGNLWWGGAIEKGMRESFAAGYEVMFWLNDDCTPLSGTMESLQRRCVQTRGIASAQSATPSGFIYSGHLKRFYGFKKVHATENQITRCDACSGNCVAIHREVVERVGFVNGEAFPHNYADLDYCLRATEAGIPLEIVGSAHCNNRDNLNWDSPFLPNSSGPDLHTRLGSLGSGYHFSSQVQLRVRHWGYFWGGIQLSAIYGKVLLGAAMVKAVPLSIRQQIFGVFSKAHRVRQFYKSLGKNNHL